MFVEAGCRISRSLALAFSLCLLVLSSSSAHAEAAIPEAPSRWVTDTVGLLSEANRTALDARLQAYEASSGHQVVVWIGRTIGSAPLDAFAVKVFQAWRIGRKGHDDGVLVILLADDRAIDIEVGYGLEARLTDALAHRIIDEVMVPRLRAGQPDAAVSSGVDAVLAGIEGRPVPNLREAAPVAEPVRPSTGSLVLVAIVGVLLLLFAVTHPSLALWLLYAAFSGGRGFGSGSGGASGGSFGGGGGRSGGGGARGKW